MTRTIRIPADPYGDRKLFEKEEFDFAPGITVLAGCNGAGKTTVLQYIKETLKKEKVPYIEFDNLRNGGRQITERAMFLGEVEVAATAILSSEGERINIALSHFVSEIGRFIRKHREDKEIWMLFDALDSGLSVDNVEEIKDFLKTVLLPDTRGQDVYIVMSGNQYSVAEGERCLDVQTGRDVQFESYEDYKAFILHSREIKDQSYGD